MTILITIFAFILTIGLIVLIHEGGHYLAAKALGIEVRRFSIGMGPVLAKFNAWKTEFAVSALPIGGYVAFVEGEESDPPERKAVLFETGPRWKRAVICVAGPLMNFILAVMLYAGVGALGVEDVVPYVTPVENSQAANAGVETFDRPVAVNGRRVGGLTDFNLALISELGERDVEITFERGEAAYTAAFDLSKLSGIRAEDMRLRLKYAGAAEEDVRLIHGVTELNATGMYSHEGRELLVCVIRKRQIGELQRILRRYPGTFASFSPVSEVYGKFLK